MSNYTRHTPGPWTRSDDIISAGTLHVAMVTVFPENWKANARLIAAAPDLLAVVREVAEAFLTSAGKPWGYCSINESTRARAQAAIAKAEGTS